ncbi:MAG: dihydroorotate dehydrogenase electron transfer subunit, partial [Actinomycetota bacterium]|nr:dihydroorotate dehydrogenase electron transfer subunit [Actinomycetota bacterium]
DDAERRCSPGQRPRCAPALEPRTLAPPARRTAEVVGCQHVGAYRLLSTEDLSGPTDPRPGQFYMLAAAKRWGGGGSERPYLPRAFSYARAEPMQEGVRLSFLVEDVGPGTERLAELRPGEGLLLVGPLGVGFRLPREGRRPVLVGGGIGTAPLVCLSDELEDAIVLLGFRSAVHAVAAALFHAGPGLASDDGSVGRHGLVIELLGEELARDDPAEVFACGPPPMLEAVRALCAERGVPAQLAMEAGMACGFGACFGCVVPTHDGFVRLCVDGPVLDADMLESALTPGGGHQG